MGAMHETFLPITAKDIAKSEGVNIATIRFRWNKAFAKGTFDSNRELSQDEVAAISQQTKGRAAKPAKSAPRKSPTISADFDSALNQNYETESAISNPTPAPASGVSSTAPGRAKMAWPVFGLSEFLALAVYGHTALVWYEVSVIFALPGILAGVVLFALKHAAVVICRSEKYADYAADALGVAFVLDGLAVWVHYTAFSDAMPDRFKDGAEFWAALILGLVVASGAFVSLYFTEKTAKQ